MEEDMGKYLLLMVEVYGLGMTHGHELLCSYRSGGIPAMEELSDEHLRALIALINEKLGGNFNMEDIGHAKRH